MLGVELGVNRNESESVNFNELCLIYGNKEKSAAIIVACKII